MRINQYLAAATGLSRRAADKVVLSGLVTIDGKLAMLGQEVGPTAEVRLKNNLLSLPESKLIILNKPAGYVVSREGQGSRTVYSLLPKEFASLKPVGRLDKDSSGLLLLTNDGLLAQKLTHPKYQKTKVYDVRLDKILEPSDQRNIKDGVRLSDGISQMGISGSGKVWSVTLSQGRNRQIRRTFKELGYDVLALHRIKFGPYELNELLEGHYAQMSTSVIL